MEFKTERASETVVNVLVCLMLVMEYQSSLLRAGGIVTTWAFEELHVAQAGSHRGWKMKNYVVELGLDQLVFGFVFPFKIMSLFMGTFLKKAKSVLKLRDCPFIVSSER